MHAVTFTRWLKNGALLGVFLAAGCGQDNSADLEEIFQTIAGRDLEHAMQPWERALMPKYLEAVSPVAAVAPPAPVRNVAEFEPMEGVLIRYPLGIPVTVVKEMAEDVMVTTIVSGPSQESQARSQYSSAGVDLSHCNFLHAPSDSMWTRDYGPWYVHDGSGDVNVLDFTYNRPRPNDNNIPSRMATFLGIDTYAVALTHAGGNYMTDGEGISASTDLVWEENSGLTHQQIADRLKNHAGINTYHVTQDPLGSYIKHIDCWGKYLDVDKVLITRVPAGHSQYADYEAVADYFAKQTSSWGNPYQVYRVFSPNGEPYTNSIILNDKVLVPLMGSSADAGAISSYQSAMPGYEVLGFAGDWYTEDALHCRAKGVADRTMVYIEHLPLSGSRWAQRGYVINAKITPYGGSPLDITATKVHYRVDGGAYHEIAMTHTTGNSYTATIPSPASGTTVGYYIIASDTAGKTNQHPLIGAADPHQFTISQVGCQADFTFAVNNMTVNFTDTSSSTAGTITGWRWSFGDGQTSSAQNPQHTYGSAGTFNVGLQVTDSASNVCSTSKPVAVGNQAPSADFSFSINGSTVGFTDKSNDPDGSIAGWAWDFGDGTSSTAQHPTHTYASTSLFNVSLTVTDNGGKTASVTKEVDLTPAYCAAKGLDYAYEWIARVQIAAFSKASGAAAYSDFTASVVELSKGASHAVTLTPGYASGTYDETWVLWIDLNRDGDFADSGERLASTSQSGAVSTTLTVPGSAVDGRTRLRVAMRYGQAPPACGDFDYGEVEDYTVSLTGR